MTLPVRPGLSLAGAPFLVDPAFRAVVGAIEAGRDRARVVGGAVRNTLLGEAVDDVDIATTARPEAVMERAVAAGLKAVPTGIDHGTVTVVASGRPFEVTTLRSDVTTDGRRAVVAFTDDWLEDARRRDFTMNALYVDRDGRVFDPVGGYDDALARRVRFIGDPEARITEDYLRILRFFRFFARYGHGEPDEIGFSACRALKDGLDRLSRERVGTEMRKIVTARGAAEAVVAMNAAGILEKVLPPPLAVDRFVRLVGIRRASRQGIGVAMALAALCEETGGLGEALRLSNRERQELVAIAAASATIGPNPDEIRVKGAVYRHGNAAAEAALARLEASETAVDEWLHELARSWRAPVFPVRAADLIAAGMSPGPALGAELRRREAAWIAAGYPERG